MATERQRKDEPIPIIPCKVRDEPRWKLDTVSDGVRKRQFFASRADAVNARKAALQDRAALGKAWAILTAAQKAKLMHTVKEIEDKGYTIEHVWLAFQGMKNAPASVCTLRQAIAETIEAKRKANRRPGYVDGLEQYLNQFAKGRTATPISHFTAELIEQWFNGRGEAPETRN